MTALIIGLFVGIYLLANIIILRMYIQEEEADAFAITLILILGVQIALIGAIVTFFEELNRRD